LKLKKSKVIESVKRALQEDGFKSDLSLMAKNIDSKKILKATLITRQNGVLSGSSWFEESFKQIDKKAKFKWKIIEGETFKRDDVIAEISANSNAILSGERTALNFLQLMSGISTKTNKYSKLLKNCNIELLDTRKTLPGLRYEQKYSTFVGGAINHRFGLYDAIMLKDNHLKAFGGIKKIKNIEFSKRGDFLEIEIERLSQIKSALKSKPDILLLDNLNQKEIKKAISLIDGKCLIEVSGIKKPEDIKKYQNLPIHYVSLGDLTKNIESIDFSLNVS
jgi:nicotinate-nucleotide pyrophosphorylase (carboxylating)